MPEIDKQQHYGRYMAQEQINNDRANANLSWRDKLDQKLRHKALDIPMGPDAADDPLNVDNRKTSTYSGLDWKHLAVIAATGLAGMGLYRLGGNAQPSTLPAAPPAIVAPVVPPLPSVGSYKTEIEIRDAITHEPIRVDWVESPPLK